MLTRAHTIPTSSSYSAWRGIKLNHLWQEQVGFALTGEHRRKVCPEAEVALGIRNTILVVFLRLKKKNQEVNYFPVVISEVGKPGSS